MLDSLAAFFVGAPLEASIGAGEWARRCGGVTMTRPASGNGADARSFAVTPGILRLAAAGAIAVNGSLPLIEFWRVAVLADGAPVRYAALATAATVALHLRHVAFGLRNERPPAGAWTLAALAVVNVAATILVGRIWTMQFASLAVSVLIVVSGPGAPVLAAAIALSPLLLAQTPLRAWQFDVDSIMGLPERYLALSIAWRTVTLYVPVRLVAMIQQLDAARRSLESRAVIQTRSRIEEDIRSGLALAIQRLISSGE